MVWYACVCVFVCAAGEGKQDMGGEIFTALLPLPPLSDQGVFGTCSWHGDIKGELTLITRPIGYHMGVVHVRRGNRLIYILSLLSHTDTVCQRFLMR